jgi:sec-independent protein translocase protein TatA
VFSNLGTTELVIIGIVVLILFGARFLPKMGKDMGENTKELKKASKEFKEAIKNGDEE